MWSFEEIRRAIELDSRWRTKPLLLGLSDFQIPLGVGIGGEDSVVLIVPGEEYESSVVGKFFSFEPWTVIHPEGLDPISGVGVLTIQFPSISETELDALASLFLGIVQMQTELGSSAKSSRVIKSLSALFESRFKLEVSKNAIVGLSGELLAIYHSIDPDFFVSTWRSQDTKRYDFSSNELRLEVKTSTQVIREHEFSSNQLPVQYGIELVVLSVLYHEVENGISLSELFNLVWEKLNQKELKLKLLSVCVETLGSHPNFVLTPNFDLVNTIESMQFFKPECVPQPVIVPGVTYMNWKAVLVDGLALGVDSSENLFVLNMHGGS